MLQKEDSVEGASDADTSVDLPAERKKKEEIGHSLPETFAAEEPYNIPAAAGIECSHKADGDQGFRSTGIGESGQQEDENDNVSMSSSGQSGQSNADSDRNRRRIISHSAHAPPLHLVRGFGEFGVGEGGSTTTHPGAQHVYPSDYTPSSANVTNRDRHEENDIAIPIAAYVVPQDDSPSPPPLVAAERVEVTPTESEAKSSWCKKKCIVIILVLLIAGMAAITVFMVGMTNNGNNGTAACTLDSDCDSGQRCHTETKQCVDCVTHSDCYGLLPFCHAATHTCCECLQNSDCDDSLYCNGAETCQGLTCMPGIDPCAAEHTICNENTASCVECLQHSDCPADFICAINHTCQKAPCNEAGDCEGHDSFCNPIECKQGVCTAGAEPCSGDRPFCIEELEQCVECLGKAHCDNSKFCKPESCNDGFCVSGSSPCPEQRPFCVEDAKDCFECIEDVHCQDSGSFCSPKVCKNGFCTDGTDPCPPERPYCDEDAMTCFECIRDRQCPDNGSFCEPNICQNGHCNTGSSPCSGSRPICYETAEKCVECINDNHCTSQTPFCDQDTSTCKECIHDHQCDDHDSFCNPSICQNGVCQSGSAPCSGSHPYCKEDAQKCVACLTNDHCPMSHPICDVDSHECVEQCEINWAAKLVANDGKAHDQFGLSVGVSGDYAVIGASNYHRNDDETRDGAAYVYSHSASDTGTWTQQAKLLPDDGVKNDEFGSSVAMDGNTVIVGASGYFQYAAYVFIYSGNMWSQQAKLKPNDGKTGTYFGKAVAISGDTAVIGAPSGGTGSVYVFTRSGNAWAQQAKLVPNDGIWGDEFGVSVAIDGDTLVIGAEGDARSNSDAPGAAYIFTRSGTTWIQQAKLIPKDGKENDAFGCSVAVDKDTVVVGARHNAHNGKTSGSAYVFEKSGTKWSKQAKLVPNDGVDDNYDFFGYSTAISGDTIVVGSAQDDNSNGNVSGSAYVFTRSGTTWTQHAKLLPNDAGSFTRFGSSAAFDENTVLVGAYGNEGGESSRGSAYVVHLC